METRHLIDGIVRQTTVLIAQLATVAGIRAPLSRVADRIFLNEGCSRSALMERFRRDDPADVAAVLRDLVDSGLVARAGRGEHAFYQIASSEAVAAIAKRQQLDGLANLIRLAIYDRQQVERMQLVSELAFEAESAQQAIDTLIRDGRIALEVRDGKELLVCRTMLIPVGAEQGWEAAVFDHFRAVANAIAAKLQRHGPRSNHGDVVGGSTVTFSLRSGHAFEPEVFGLLARMRAETSALWDRVSELNKQQPIDPAERIEVTFYFGQSVVMPSAERNDEE